jgi:hydrogenase small subunit
MADDVHANGAVDLLWLTAGLSCDGDSVSMTAATQPALEDLIAGALPGLPRLVAARALRRLEA